MPQDVEKIVAGLTKAQRAAMAGERVFHHERRGLCMSSSVDRRVKWRLCRDNLLSDYLGSPRFTPLGLAVRAHLLSTPNTEKSDVG